LRGRVEVLNIERDVGVVIAAAGAGSRIGRRKAFLELRGRPLLHYSLAAFARVEEVLEMAVVVNRDDLEKARSSIREWEEAAGAPGRDLPRITATPGGERRQDSVWRGMEALSAGTRWILVHDAARPLILPEDIRHMIAAVREHGAAVIGHPSSDSIREVSGGFISRDLDRERVWAVQTPQGARADKLRRAFRMGIESRLEVTDEVGLLLSSGIPVRLVQGERTNIKVTYPEDLLVAGLILDKKSSPAP